MEETAGCYREGTRGKDIEEAVKPRGAGRRKKYSENINKKLYFCTAREYQKGI